MMKVEASSTAPVSCRRYDCHANYRCEEIVYATGLSSYFIF